MSRTWVIAAVVSLLLHAGFFFGGQLLKSHPTPKPAQPEIPTVELIPVPPIEPEKTEDVPDPADKSDISDIVPPMQADLPSIADSPFTQQMQAIPPLDTIRPTGVITIPKGRLGGVGSGLGNIFDLASLDQIPETRIQSKPVYPFDLQRAGIEGSVTVGFIVDASGNVREPYIVSSTNRDFEKATLDMVLKYKYHPGKKSGIAVATRVIITISFKLQQN